LCFRRDDGIFATVKMRIPRTTTFLAARRRPRPIARRRPRAIASGVLLMCALLASLATAPGAFASTTNELRGEWSFELKCECKFPTINTEKLEGSALISSMDLETGVFSGTTDFATEPGEFVENLLTHEKPHVTENKIEYIIRNQSPGGEFYFVVPEGTVSDNGNEMSGPGIYNPGSQYEEQGSFYAKKIRTWAEVEKEQKEKLEREAREKGEREGRSKGEQEGRAKGEQEGREKAEQEVKLKAAQEATERSATEAQAKAEREAREKTEKEAAEKAETKAREKAEQEAREKITKEAGQKTEKEAKGKAEREAKERLRTTAELPAVLVGKAFTVASSGQLSLELTNANDYSVSGALTLSPAVATKPAVAPGGTSKPAGTSKPTDTPGGASGGSPSTSKESTVGKAKPVVLAEASYTISSHGSRAVTFKLAKSTLAELEHHKTLQLVVTVTTRASGKLSSTKTYDITLKLAPAKHG
jgi:hypothetical protein